MLDEQAKMMTGFESWAAAGPFWDQPAANQFRVLVGGQGRIKGEIVTWAGSQTVTLAANRTAFVYMDSTGTIGQATDVTVSEATFTDNIVLFEILYDGTNVTVTKENHPYNFQTEISRFLHNNVGVVIRGTGAIPTRVSTGTGAAAGDREIKIVGADILEDHGLETTIPDSAGAGVTWNFYYKNAGGQWLRNASQTQVPMLYNNAGTPTAISSGSYGIMRIGVSKDSLNSSTPVYFAVFHSAQYANVTQAQNAIAAGGIVNWDNELAAIEIAQLGYIVVQNNASGGYINQIDVQKSSFSTRFVGGAGTGDHGLLTGLTDDDHPQYALLAGRSGDTYVTEAIQALGAGGISLKNSSGNEVLLLGDTGIQATFQDSLTVTGILEVNQINERTSGSGLNIDGVLLKDSTVRFNGDPDTYFSNPAPNEIAITTGGTEISRISSAGIEIKTGGLELPNGGTVLNWHQVGTFTPAIKASGTAGTPVQRAGNNGDFTRVGDRCFVNGVVGITDWTDSPTGGVQISSLPFVGNTGTVAVFNVAAISALTFGTDTTLSAIGQNGTAILDLVSFSTGTNPIVVPVTDTNFNLRFSGNYKV